MRLKNIILTDLLHKRVVAYEEMERLMNKKSPISPTIEKIEGLLKHVVMLNNMITEWEGICSSPEQIINEEKKE